MELFVEGTALSMRRFLKDGNRGHVGLMNPWTGRYAWSDKFDVERSDAKYLLGRLWILYLQTRRAEFREWAMTLLEKIVPAVTDAPHTSRGSACATYYGICLGADITGSDELRKAALRSADLLIEGLWNSQADVFYSKPNGLSTNIDSLATLLLLPWCARYDPKYMDYYTRHADSIIRVGIIRPDGSTFQRADFDEKHRLKAVTTNQGWKPTSTWARGQSWAMHNFICAYEATGRASYLDVSVRAANWWVEHVPQDFVPYYDFDDPQRFEKPRDSCAATIAVLALIRLAKARPDLAATYEPVITSTLNELYKNYITDGGLVVHGSWGDARWQVGRPRPLRFPQEDVMPFGQYYLAEALYRRLTDDWSLLRLAPKA